MRIFSYEILHEFQGQTIHLEVTVYSQDNNSLTTKAFPATPAFPNYNIKVGKKKAVRATLVEDVL